MKSCVVSWSQTQLWAGRSPQPNIHPLTASLCVRPLHVQCSHTHYGDTCLFDKFIVCVMNFNKITVYVLYTKVNNRWKAICYFSLRRRRPRFTFFLMPHKIKKKKYILWLFVTKIWFGLFNWNIHFWATWPQKEVFTNVRGWMVVYIERTRPMSIQYFDFKLGTCA